MPRITFSIPEKLAVEAQRKADTTNRSLSAYISGLVQKDVAPEVVNLRAEAIAAIDEIGPEKAAKILRRAARS